MTAANKKYVLIIEDSDDDYEFASEVIGSNLPDPMDLKRCESGTEAVEFLQAQASDSQKRDENPCQLILLDLNLPGLHGAEVLQRIKSSQNTCSVPVVVLTTSKNEKDVSNCYRLGANSFVQKPIDLSEFTKTLSKIGEYWLNFSVLPGNHDVQTSRARE